MWNRSRHLIALLAAALLLCGACSGGSKNDDKKQKSSKKDAGGKKDTGGSSGPTWQIETIEGGGWGKDLDLVVSPGGTVSVAYYSASGNRGEPCTEIGDMSPPKKVRWPLHFAQRKSGKWEIETVSKQLFVSAPPGLDLEIDPNGTPAIASSIGEPLEMFGYCGANDAGIYSRMGKGNWSKTTVATSSSDVAVSKSGADFGEVVGNWPSLAYDSSGGTAVVYRDIHAGGRQRDDFGLAALEIAVGGGGSWSHYSVDPYRGAGLGNTIIFDQKDRPLVTYILPEEGNVDNGLGIWIARSEDGGKTWTKNKIFNQGTNIPPAVAVDRDSGEISVLYYNSRRGFPQLMSLEDPTRFDQLSSWKKKDIGNSRYDEGYDPSIAIGPNGMLHAVYYRCTKASSGLGDCKSNEDALVHAWSDGGFWEREVIDEGGDGLCGRVPALGFDSNNHPVVAYRCEEMVEGNLETTVRFAVKK